MEELDSILLAIENIKEPFYERDVGTLIHKMKGKEDDLELPNTLIAEYMAFDFYEDNSSNGSIWGTYFGPMFSGINKDGNAYESPSIKLITHETLKYWTNRAKQAKHPILKARYSALVWDFSKEVKKESVDIEMAHIWIDSVIRIAETNCHKYESYIIQKLRKVLNIAISINDEQRIEKVKNTILLYEFKILGDKSERWGFSFDTLLMNKKIQLSKSEHQLILNDLENRLNTTSNFSQKAAFDQFDAKEAAIRLAQYYRKQNKPDDIKRVLLKYGNAFEQSAKDASGTLALAWLHGVESVYRNFGIKAEADRLLNKIRKRGPDAQKDLVPIPFEQKIPRKEMDSYVNEMIEGDIDQVITRIAICYIPKKNEVIKQLNELATINPLLYDMPLVIQDHSGRRIAVIGSLDNDLNGQMIIQICQNMHISSIYLHHVICGFREKFSVTPDSITKKLHESPLFTDKNIEVIKKGLEEYWKKDHLVAIHLLIPQIESITRRLLELSGVTTYKRSRNEGFQLKTFDEMLRDNCMCEAIGEDAVFYFRILYTDPRGWNLRNNVCHGISLINEFSVQASDRIFQTLLLLGQIREQKEKI